MKTNEELKDEIIKLFREKEDKDICDLYIAMLNGIDLSKIKIKSCRSACNLAPALSIHFSRKIKIPIPFTEASCKYDILEKDLFRVFKKLKKELDIKNCNKEEVAVSGSCSFVPKVEDYLYKLHESVSKEEVLFFINKMKRIDNHPMAILGCIEYSIRKNKGEKVTQREIADRYGCNEVTFRSVLKRISINNTIETFK